MKNLKQLTLVSALIAAAGLGAQESVGTVVGTVRDASGAAVANATVRISGPNLLVPREAVTDANGRYTFRLLMPGQARVTVSKQGLIGGAQSITVTSGSTLTIDFTMKAIGVATEEVEILGGTENPIVDKTETKVTSTYTIKDLLNLPMGGTGVYGALFLAPGVSGDTSYARIRGGTSGQTTYSINGIMMRDPEVGQGRQYEYVIDDLIQDVQVVQNPINAKYGFTSSGSVNITTKTGTNKFEGSFRFVGDNGAWNAINGSPRTNRWGEHEYSDWATTWWPYGAPTVPADNLAREYHVTLSGPIWKDRITFSYGGRFQPKDVGYLTAYNVMNSTTQTSWRTYIPGFLTTDPKYTGPNPNNPSQTGEMYAGYFWDHNPARPQEILRRSGTSNYTFNQYKLFFQITPNHQVDIVYSSDVYTTFGANSVDTPDQSLLFWQDADRIMKGFNYRGILGANAVLSAQWGRRTTTVQFPKGPDDTLFYQSYQGSAVGILAAGNGTGVLQLATGGAYSYDAIRDSENWAIDLNYIWDAHNFDVGVQRLNERSTTSGYGIRNRAFWAPAMRYDGTYMVFNPFHPDSPVQTYNGVTAGSGTGSGYSTLAAWKLGVLGGTRVPYYRQYGTLSDKETPHDAQTTSVYINDNWTFSDNLAINVGIRADQTIVTDVRGELVNSMSINPRFRVQYDLFGDNRHVFALSLTQQVGNLYRAAMGAYAVNNQTQSSRRWIWNTGGPTPIFVDKATFKDTSNYGQLYSYTDSTLTNFVDSDLKPEQTTNVEFSYRRAFSQGGYFRVSLIYGQLTRALFSEIKDEAREVLDPIYGSAGPYIPSYNYKMVLYNRDDRGRHYGSAEMDWSMPLVAKQTWTLRLGGNWTIAKTTGNYTFEASNQSALTEGSTAQYYDALVGIGMPRELVDPWGESNVTPRHRVRSYLMFTHGERGGIINELNLFANWDSATYGTSSWSYNLPNNTFQNSTQNGGLGTNFPTSATMYPYGFANVKYGSSGYYCDFTWNVTIPIKGTLSFFVNYGIGNIFNSIVDATGYYSWSAGNNGAARVWRAEANSSGVASMDDPIWGKYVGNRGAEEGYGVYGNGGGARQFNMRFDVGFRF